MYMSSLQYRIYPIKDGKGGESLPFKLCDSMGLDEEEGAGLCMDDIRHILKGCMPDRYHVRTLISKAFQITFIMHFVEFLLHMAVSTIVR